VRGSERRELRKWFLDRVGGTGGFIKSKGKSRSRLRRRRALPTFKKQRI